MSVTLDDITSALIDEDKCEKIEGLLLDEINRHELNLRELVYIIALMIVNIGGSLEKVETTLDYETMWKRYTDSPTLGNALISFGADVLSEWLKIPGMSKEGEIDDREEKRTETN